MIAPLPASSDYRVQNQPITLGAEVIGATPILYRWRRIASSGAGIILTNFLRTAGAISTDLFETNSPGTFTTRWYVQFVYPILNVAWTNALVTIGRHRPRWPARRLRSGAWTNAMNFRLMRPGADGDEAQLGGIHCRHRSKTRQSYLRVEFDYGDGEATIKFGAISNRTYTLQYQRQNSRWQLAGLCRNVSNRPTYRTVADPLL